MGRPIGSFPAGEQTQDSSLGSVLVVGAIARDLVLRVDHLPDAGGSTAVQERIERLGGKGANQGVGLRQLGADVALLGVVGDDPAGRSVLDEAEAGGVQTGHVIERGRTGLLVDLVEDRGIRRLLEDTDPSSELTPADISAAGDAFGSVRLVCLQLQQPIAALLAAAHLARQAGVQTLLDGGVTGAGRDELVGMAAVVRADAAETEMLTGIAIGSTEDARRASARLLDRGPRLVALAVPDAGDFVAWPGGEIFLPFPEDETVVDPTGAGDAFTAGLVAGLLARWGPGDAAKLAARCAASVVGRLGGRPDLAALAPLGAEVR